MKSDLEIAQEAKLEHILNIAEKAGIKEEEIELYGRYKAKIDYESVLDRLKAVPDGKYIDVTAITPTPLGEGKTTTSIGLTQALAKLGKKVVLTLREPSMGPVFGIKGGACGGGYSQVVPMEDINLHFTGDIHAVGAAHNLLAAMIDASILHKNPLNINPLSVVWPRVVDISDRALRRIIIGLGGSENGYPRETGFDITVASEVMAILALATNLKDLRERLGRIVIGYSYDNKPVVAEDLKAAGAMAALLKEAIKPNLVQTLEKNPVIMHTGPFANVAHGNNSILACKIALKLADFVVTESGFGADCGMEKFMNIKCRYGNLKPDCVVVVTTIRALKMHGGAFDAKPGRPFPYHKVGEINMPALEKGCENLEKQIENVKLFGVPAVVAINVFHTDRDEEIELVKEKAKAAGAFAAVKSEVWEKGGEGGLQLAEAVIEAIEKEESKFSFLYDLSLSIEEKIETIATKIYGADSVTYSTEAKRKIEEFSKFSWDKLPINMAKTHLSLSHNPDWKGRPKGWTLPIVDIRASVGAGFLYPLCGPIRTMPGLPSSPAATKVDIDLNTGKIVGLF